MAGKIIQENSFYNDYLIYFIKDTLIPRAKRNYLAVASRADNEGTMRSIGLNITYPASAIINIPMPAHNLSILTQ
jgi:hypothetical protein